MSDPRVLAAHVCEPAVLLAFGDMNLDDDFDVAFGALGLPGGGSFMTLHAGELAWGLSVNGGEYRGPIAFCPWCGQNLAEVMRPGGAE